MYSFIVVVVQVRRKACLDGMERLRGLNVAAGAFFLYGSVKALNVRIVVRAMQSRVSGLDTPAMEPVLEVAAELWSVVTLHHGEQEPKADLGGQDSVCRQPRSNNGMGLDVCHATKKIDDRVEIVLLTG